MANYILIENGYAVTIYKNIDESILNNLKMNLKENQELLEVENNELLKSQLPPLSETDILNELRERRESECFSIINRGELWYNKLTEEQIEELNLWYQNWLNVTITKEIPTKPAWLK